VQLLGMTPPSVRDSYRRPPVAILVVQALSGLALLGLAAHAAYGFGGSGSDAFFTDWVYDGIIVVAALLCLSRAVLSPSLQKAWLLLGLGIGSWAAGEIYYTVALAHAADPPYPSIGDALSLAFYPASYAALMLLVKDQLDYYRASLWLDGLVAALGSAAVAVALLLEPVLRSTEGNFVTVATDLAYPLGDALLLATIMAILSVCGWRPGRTWLFIGAALLVTAIGDGVFLRQVAAGTYVPGTLLDVLWPAAALLLGFGAWARWHAPPRAMGGRLVMVMPAVFALLALGVLVLDHYSRISAVALWLAAATLLAVVARMAMSFAENTVILSNTRRDAMTDQLTGLGNRRRLMYDLERELPLATDMDPRAFSLFDLDGFKRYNDTFGHPAGDALLARLGRRLDAAVRPYGKAYRLGGDEFCVLLRVPHATDPRLVHASVVEALTDRGSGFTVTASCGTVAIPADTADPTSALQLADGRLYREKGERANASDSDQTRNVLLAVLEEHRAMDLGAIKHTAELAVAVGRHLGLPAEQLDEVARATELHDIGKMAVPEPILSKTGPLDSEEWDLVRQHPLVSERILGRAPALRPVGRIVRAARERWDGDGYPDGLAGEDIPLGARIVAVCHAFDAMTHGRPYATSRTAAEALQEIVGCAGTQFDPRVVEVFCEQVLEDQRASAKPVLEDVLDGRVERVDAVQGERLD
jgi:diguanylate cyclase (GGDEF)-like protein